MCTTTFQSTYIMNGEPLQSVKSHVYLGVEINHNLSWKNHISNITSKSYQVLGLLRRNLYNCSTHVKEIAYKTLVRPKLKYCASVWDPHHQEHKNRLEAVQRRAARFVCKDSRRKSSVSLMISKLQWKSLEERRAISRLSLLYKSVYHKTAIDTDHYQFKPQGNQTLTRKSSSISFTHPSTKKDCYKFSFLQELLLNGIYYQYVFREAPSIDSFKTRLDTIQITTFIRGAHH